MSLEFTGLTLDRATPGSAGYDLYYKGKEAKQVQPGETAKLETGIRVKLPAGHYGQVASRSSLAAKGHFVVGGVIDSDYRGELVVIMHNSTGTTTEYKPGQKIAQLLVLPCFKGHALRCAVFTKEEGNQRGEQGFGSTGY